MAEEPASFYVEAMLDGMEDYEPLGGGGVMTYQDLVLWAMSNGMEGIYRMTEVSGRP